MAKISPRQFYTSHRDDTHDGGLAPPKPHLAVRVGKDQILAIPEGAHLFFIRDPRQVTGIVEVIFEKLKFENDVPHEIHFVVPSNDQTSTRKAVAHITWHGEYKSWTKRQADQELADQEAKLTEDEPDD